MKALRSLYLISQERSFRTVSGEPGISGEVPDYLDLFPIDDALFNRFLKRWQVGPSAIHLAGIQGHEGLVLPQKVVHRYS